MGDAIAITVVLLGGAWTLAFNRTAIQLVARGGTGTALAFIGASLALLLWCLWCAYWIVVHAPW